ncbi:MAG: sialate O-acetylesterase, partial [Rikenellaceae bacterium]
MIVVNDLVHDVKNIHPKDKKSVGYRFADMALERLYGAQNVDSHYPEIENYTVKGDKIIVTIKNCGGGVVAVDGQKSGFKIASADGNFVDAQAKIKGCEITLSAKGVKSPVEVRY